jgi:hypothetical protein
MELLPLITGNPFEIGSKCITQFISLMQKALSKKATHGTSR